MRKGAIGNRRFWKVVRVGINVRVWETLAYVELKVDWDYFNELLKVRDRKVDQ